MLQVQYIRCAMSDYGCYNVTEPPIDAPRDPLYKSEREISKVHIGPCTLMLNPLGLWCRESWATCINKDVLSFDLTTFLETTPGNMFFKH